MTTSWGVASRSARSSTSSPGAQVQAEGTENRVPGRAPDQASYGSLADFGDPDGNSWLLQEITTRLPGRIDAADDPSVGDRSRQRVAARRGRTRRT